VVATVLEHLYDSISTTSSNIAQCEFLPLENRTGIGFVTGNGELN
jgi:hypothetical protein